MEIAVLPKNGLKIKGKKVTFLINTEEKLESVNAILYLHSIPSYAGEAVKVAGAGDFEIGGVKIVGIRSDEDIVYSMTVDDVGILVGKIKPLDTLQHKLKEHNIIVVLSDNSANAAFATSLGINAAIFYGDKASEVVHSFAKENVTEMNKFTATVDKLPTEMQTVLLA